MKNVPTNEPNFHEFTMSQHLSAQACDSWAIRVGWAFQEGGGP